MTIADKFASKLAVALVAVAMVFAAFAPAAQAQTTEELQAMINDLLAQVASLQGQVGQDGGGSMAAGVCPYTWTRDLSQGSTGMDVMKLQQFLNADPDTRVAAAGQVGSAGMETEYYGPATAAAVSKMQVKYRAQVLSPVGLVNPTGYFGASSRAAANDMCVTPAPTPDTDEDEDGMEDEDEDEDEDDMELGGSAELDVVEMDEASDDDVQEGEEDVEIGELTVEFDNGDAEISRLDLALVADDVSGNQDEDEPWEVFETISLWVDGDKIAEVDADDEDEYLDEDEGSLRFSDLDLIAMEGEEVVITIGASLQNNLDGLSDGETWQVFAVEMRYFDADGVATTEDGVEDLSGDDPEFDDAGNAEFNVEEEGEGEELNISIASSNPDSTDIIVDEDDDTNDVTIMIAELEAEEGDLEINELVVRVDTTGTLTTDVVDDVMVSIDGMTFDAESFKASPVDAATDLGDSRSFASTTGNFAWYFFDIDGDVVLEEDEEMDMEVMVDLNSQNGNYSNGQQIFATIGSTEQSFWDVEGADDLDPNNDFSGSATGEEHTLIAEGIVVPVDGVTVDESTSGDNDQTGSFEVEFEVTAVEADFYIFDRATEGAFNATTTGVTFAVQGPGSATSSGVLASTADEDNSNPNFFVVREGETETFTMTVTVDASASGQHRVSLTGVGYSDDNVNDDADDAAYQPVPVQDFRTGYININAN